MRVLIDGNHIASRCRHSQAGMLCTSDGRSSGTIYGVLRNVSYACRMTHCCIDDVVVVWDGGRSAKRIELYGAYKSNRIKENETEEEKKERRAYYSQLEALKDAIRLLGARSVKVPGCEADDVISILAHLTENPAIIYSGDYDFHQLISNQITLYNPDKGFVDPAVVMERWGVCRIDDILPVRAIVGDSSDGITGVPNLGAKRAPLVVKCFGVPIEEVDPKCRKWVELFHQHKDIYERNIQLMQLPKSVQESFFDEQNAADLLQQMVINPRETADIRAFVEFCQEWELNSVIEELRV